MVPVDRPLGHRMVGRAPRVRQPVRVQLRRGRLGEGARAVVTEQARSMDDLDPMPLARTGLFFSPA